MSTNRDRQPGSPVGSGVRWHRGAAWLNVGEILVPGLVWPQWSLLLPGAAGRSTMVLLRLAVDLTTGVTASVPSATI
jgi:hypothetical protein